MGELFALLIPMVPGLILGAKALFTKPGSGQNRMDAVLTALRSIVTKMVAVPGAVPVVQPTDEQLQAMIETILQDMKLKGQIGAPVAVSTIQTPATSALPLNRNKLLSGILALVAQEAGAE